MLSEINKLLCTVSDDEDSFVKRSMEQSAASHLDEVKKAKELIGKDERRIEELDRLFTRLYEDNVLGKIDDERFSQMPANYTDEQKKLKAEVARLYGLIEEKEQKSSDISHFLQIVRKYEHISELTPKLMHEFVEKIVVHEADKSSGHREQEVEIHFRFNVYVATITLDSREYKKTAAQEIALPEETGELLYGNGTPAPPRQGAALNLRGIMRLSTRTHCTLRRRKASLRLNQISK